MVSWKQSFEEQGFAILPERLKTPEVSNLLLNLAQVPRQRGKAGVRHLMGHSVISSLVKEPRFLNFVQEILGPEAFPFRATLFDKSSERNWLIAWHQDTALPLLRQQEMAGWGPWSVKDGVIYAHAPASALSQVVALRIHLDESTTQNGPLRVLPGTHTLGVLADEVVHELSTRLREATCTAASGEILAMRPLLIHASSKSQTEEPRRVLHIQYAAKLVLNGGMSLAVA